jgi:hypothetical protein
MSIMPPIHPPRSRQLSRGFPNATAAITLKKAMRPMADPPLGRSTMTTWPTVNNCSRNSNPASITSPVWTRPVYCLSSLGDNNLSEDGLPLWPAAIRCDLNGIFVA